MSSPGVPLGSDYRAAGGRQTVRVFDGGTARSLARQSVLVAAVCLVTDAMSFLTRGPEAVGPVEAVVLVGLVAADAALATAPRYSGWVALAHAALFPALALVLPGRNVNTAGQLVSAYRAGAWLRGRPAAATVVAMAFGVLSSLWIGGATNPFAVVTLVTANTVLPWLVGRYTTARKEYVDELRRQREAQLRDAQAEVGEAVTREREAIARDLHDVISHHISAIGVHAAATRMTLAGPVPDSLVAVESAGRAAMVDLRRLLDLLHDGESAGLPGLGKLQELVDGVRAAGLRVALAVYNDPCPLPPAVDTTFYRVAQEMLTNALRHGDGTAVRLELDYGVDSVSLTARNRLISRRSSPVAQQGSGRGLRGMRQRARAFDGTATAGPTADGQYWETSVTMPTGATS